MASKRPQSSPLHPVPCEAPQCAAAIFFATGPNHLAMPLDAEPDDAGKVAGRRDVHGTWHARWIGTDSRLGPDEKRYTSHFATCKAPAEFRRRHAAARKERPVREPDQPAQLALTL